MPLIIRGLLWILLVLAPGGVLLLPLLVGDAMAQRKKRAAQDSLAGVANMQPVEAVAVTVSSP